MIGPAVGLLRSEVSLRLRSIAVWSVSMALLVLLVVAVYPSVRDNKSLDSIYGDLSPTAQALLGGSDLTSPVGYLATQLFAFFLPAVLLVFAIGRGAGTVAGEEEEHTLDLLLAQPVRRRSVYAQKAVAVGLGVLALVIASWVPLVALDSAVQFDLAVDRLGAICLQMALFCWAAGLLAQAVAATVGRRAVGIAVTVGYTVVSYIVYGLSATVHPLTYLRPLTLWRWYLANDPLRSGVGTTEVLVLAGVCAAALAAGAAGFGRRDLRA